MDAAERLIHNAADGARAVAALGAAAETTIEPPDRSRPLRLDGGADVLIAQYVARTDNHDVTVIVWPNRNRSVVEDRRYASKDVTGDRHVTDGREWQVS